MQTFSEQELLIGGIQKQEGKIIKQYTKPIVFFLGLLLGIKRFFHLIVIVKDLANVHHTDNLIWISRILSNIALFSNTPNHTNKRVLLFRQPKYTFYAKVFASFLELQSLLIFRKNT